MARGSSGCLYRYDMVVMPLPMDRSLLCVLPVVHLIGPLLESTNWRIGFNLRCWSLSTVLVVRALLRRVLWIIMCIFLLLMLSSPLTLDCGILDKVLSSLGLLARFRHVYFQYRAHVPPRFKLAAGVGEPWARDGGIPQGCSLGMMFTVALYLPWCG